MPVMPHRSFILILHDDVMADVELGISPMYRILKKNGADRVSDESANELRKITEELAGRVAKSAVQLATHAGRKTVKGEDVRLASRMLDGS